MSAAATAERRPEPGRAGELRHDLGLVAWQVLYEQRAYWRNRVRAFFTFLLPIMFLVIFATINQGSQISSRGNISYNDFFVPGILAYGLIMATFTNMASNTALLRDEGVLKRVRGTPLPFWVYTAGRIGSTVIVTMLLGIATLTIGSLAYGVTVRASTLPGLLSAAALGTVCFTGLGMGIVRYIKSADTVQPVVNVAILPLTFISGVWFVTDSMAPWLRHLAAVFPVHAMADAFQHAFDPRVHGTGLQGGDLLNLAIWSVVGVWLMLRFLRVSGREQT